MTYYDELKMKIEFYNDAHMFEANKVRIGYEIKDWFVRNMLKEDYNIKVSSLGELIELEGLAVEIDIKIPYVIEVTYSDFNEKYIDSDYKIKPKKNYSAIIGNLFFTSKERREICEISERKSRYIDESLKDLKSWIAYNNYLKSIGEEEDNNL